jgi:hypothetical protein
MIINMPTPKDKVLYEKVKKMADEIYKKNSAYKSGYIVQEYKRRGGEYIDDKKPKELKRWFQEDWKDIGKLTKGYNYPVYRPTIRVNKKTPLTVMEINPKQLKEQIKLKQKIKGDKNLPPFKKK